MLRKLACAVFTLAVCVGLSAGADIRAVIYSVEGGKITFAEAKKKGETGEKMTLPVAKNVKVSKGKGGDPVEGGLSNALFTKIGEKGVRALVVTDSDNKTVTEIRVFGGKKKKGNN